jgi:hypothetical protein
VSQIQRTPVRAAGALERDFVLWASVRLEETPNVPSLSSGVAASGVSVSCPGRFARPFGARGTARATAAARVRRRIGADELVEVAAGSAGGLFLIDEGKSVLIELVKELFPCHPFPRRLPLRGLSSES